jgi:hypothetical protein
VSSSNEQNLSAKFVKSSPYLPPLNMQKGSEADRRGRVNSSALNSMMLSSPLSKMTARINSSDGFKQSIVGDSSNGHGIREQSGPWSSHRKDLSVSGRGAEAVAFGQGAIGIKTDASLSGANSKIAYEAQGLGWAGANGGGWARAFANENSAQGHVGAEGRVGAGIEAVAEAKVGCSGSITASTTGRAMVGAESSAVIATNLMGNTKGQKHKNNVNAEVGAFAGVKAEGTAQVNIKGNTVGVEAAAMAGIGFKAAFTASVEKAGDGERYLAFENKVAAAVGVGAGFAVKTRINVEPLVKIVGTVDEGIKIFDGAQRIGSALKNL